MDTNIARVTDLEIEQIIDKLTDNGYKQVDEAYVEVESPFTICEDCPNTKREKTLGLVLYPELLSYSARKQKPRKTEWVTVPWICVKLELEGHHLMDEGKQREIVKWVFDEFEGIGLRPFYDEDAFAACASKEEHKGWVELRLYVNPDFPKGYWSNHAL